MRMEMKVWVDRYAGTELLAIHKISQTRWISCRFALWEEGNWNKIGFRNKKDERGVVVRNKARLVAQGHRQEERIDYDEMRCRKCLPVWQILMRRSTCLNLQSFIDPKLPKKGSQSSEKLSMVYTKLSELRINPKKFVGFCQCFKTASTPIETQKPLVKDVEASDVDVHLYRSMIGSLMYLTASRPDIMFVVCACSRFQVNPKTSHLSD
ncbi:hypothetical protein Tco_0681547 [Tanacetum coccineum]|uniref:Gag-pol polyprotein n=1 Tax=Tanacetum coccineum TaxID=301880 RepID=A0ABQ4XPX7_9ASTR